MPDIKLTLVIGKYAQAWHLENLKTNLTDTVRGWRSYGAAFAVHGRYDIICSVKNLFDLSQA